MFCDKEKENVKGSSKGLNLHVLQFELKALPQCHTNNNVILEILT